MEIFLISVLGLVMGFVTSVSGGAGVFAVPTMLAFGIPPISVLALNRMSDVGVVFGALKNYWKVVNWKLALKIFPFLAVGSYLGANFVIRMDPAHLHSLILFGVVVGMIFLVKPARPFKSDVQAAKWRKIFAFFMLFVVGIWSGALAMAGATFAVLVLVYLFSKKYVEARSIEVVAAIPETLISSVILISAANVNYFWLLAMFLSSFVGAYAGSHMAVKHGDKLIKIAMIGIGLIMLAKLIFGF